MFRRAILLAALTAALMLLPVQAQTVPKARISMGTGSITYNPQMFERPDIDRLTALRLLLNDFVYGRCVAESPDNRCVLPNIERPNIHVTVLPYAEFEALVIERLEQQYPESLPRLLGDGLLIRGMMHPHRLGARDIRLSYFQMPSDKLWVHELMHVIFPFSVEEDVIGKVTAVLSGHKYKNWLRENY